MWLCQEELLTLRKLPTEGQIEEVRRQRYARAQRQVQRERERERERARDDAPAQPGGAPAAGGARRPAPHDDNNPLLEQMNIIREYIKEARKELKFEEVSWACDG